MQILVKWTVRRGKPRARRFRSFVRAAQFVSALRRRRSTVCAWLQAGRARWDAVS